MKHIVQRPACILCSIKVALVIARPALSKLKVNGGNATYPAGNGGSKGHLLSFSVSVLLPTSVQTQTWALFVRRTCLVVLQPVLPIPVYNPSTPQSATALTCSPSYLFRAGPDAASHPPLCSQPENGYMCKWQDEKGKFIFLNQFLKTFLFRIWDRGRSYLTLVCPFLL